MTVHRDLRINVPNHLIIDSANLHLDEPVGQGMLARITTYMCINML